MRYLKDLQSLNESVEQSTDLSEVKKMANAQKYAFKDTGKNSLVFDLKVNKAGYQISLSGNGEFTVYSSLKEADLPEVTVYGDRPGKISGKWSATKMGVSFEYKTVTSGDFKTGEKLSTASAGLNAIDSPIGQGLLGKKDFESFIKSTSGSWVPINAPYQPSNLCINPETLQEILDGKCFLVRGSKCSAVGLVQSMLNLIRPKFESAGEKWPMEIEADNSYGKITYDAVKEFQKIQKFKPDIKSDGIVGKNTLQALNMAKEESEKREMENVKVEIKKTEIEEVKIPKEELVEIDQLPPIELQTEIQKTLKEIRLEKKESRKKKRLLARLERLKKREEKIKDKIEKIGESTKNHLKHLLLFESFLSESDWYTVNRPGWDPYKTITTSSYGLRLKGVNAPFKEKEVVVVKQGLYSKLPGQIINVFYNENTGEVIYGIRFFEPGGATSLGKEEPKDLELLATVPDYVLNHPKFEK